MTPEERHEAAFETIYDLERLSLQHAAAVDYLAELAGVTREDLVQVAERAHADERAVIEGIEAEGGGSGEV
jgi:predicted Zn-dependent peptidase